MIASVIDGILSPAASNFSPKHLKERFHHYRSPQLTNRTSRSITQLATERDDYIFGLLTAISLPEVTNLIIRP